MKKSLSDEKKTHSRWLSNNSSTYISNELKKITVYILLFLRLNFTRFQAKNQRRINSKIFELNHQAFLHFSNSHQTAHNKNHHLSKFATGISQHNTQNQSIREKNEKNIRCIRTITHDDYQLSTKTTHYLENDGIKETILQQDRRRL